MISKVPDLQTHRPWPAFYLLNFRASSHKSSVLPWLYWSCVTKPVGLNRDNRIKVSYFKQAHYVKILILQKKDNFRILFEIKKRDNIKQNHKWHILHKFTQNHFWVNSWSNAKCSFLIFACNFVSLNSFVLKLVFI